MASRTSLISGAIKCSMFLQVGAGAFNLYHCKVLVMIAMQSGRFVFSFGRTKW